MPRRSRPSANANDAGAYCSATANPIGVDVKAREEATPGQTLELDLVCLRLGEQPFQAAHPIVRRHHAQVDPVTPRVSFADGEPFRISKIPRQGFAAL
jgi:hypothetical protein